MRRILTCCGIVGLLFWAGPNWNTANKASAVSISGSGVEMAGHVPSWVRWPQNARIDSAKVEENAATGALSGIVQVTVSGDLPTVEGAFIQNLRDGGYAVHKVTLPADRFFGAFSALEAVDSSAHRRINVVLRDEPWSASARIFFIETPQKPLAGEAA